MITDSKHPQSYFLDTMITKWNSLPLSSTSRMKNSKALLIAQLTLKRIKNKSLKKSVKCTFGNYNNYLECARSIHSWWNCREISRIVNCTQLNHLLNYFHTEMSVSTWSVNHMYRISKGTKQSQFVFYHSTKPGRILLTLTTSHEPRKYQEQNQRKYQNPHTPRTGPKA